MKKQDTPFAFLLSKMLDTAFYKFEYTAWIHTTCFHKCKNKIISWPKKKSIIFLNSSYEGNLSLVQKVLFTSKIKQKKN